MFYSIRHVTRYRYSNPVTESHMEVRMHPRSEANQRCWEFELQTAPRARTNHYRDSLGNTVHHFDVPARHTRMAITAQSLVEVDPPTPFPEAIDLDAWDVIDAAIAEGEHWEMLGPSKFARRTPLLEELAVELKIGRHEDPITILRQLNTDLRTTFEYAPQSTRVDSPIDDALRERRGVCQDFSHIMIALVRGLGIPCRYVSGYLFHGEGHNNRSIEGATHAWVEAWLPEFGWIGFDPTNDIFGGDQHIRVAVGRDYADVPPTRGVFRGQADSELSVSVQVVPSEAPMLDDNSMPGVWTMLETEDPVELTALQLQQQQQQQQQQ